MFCSLSHEQVAAGAQHTLEFPSSWMEQSLAAVGFQTVESSGHGSSGASVGHSGPSLSPPTPFSFKVFSGLGLGCEAPD